ncbi:MAG: ATP-binding protein [Planctomycetaceae bacterium]|nr:ATP-binding protein [Planctomycetaceae bacterium]
MVNPFQYGSVVSGDAFCNRTEELRDLRRSCDNAEKLFVYSERRLGKTSLVRSVLRELPQKKFVAVYVDLWPTDSENSFATTTARAISLALASTPKQVLDTARKMFRQLVPSVSVGEDGTPTVSFGTVTPRRPEIELEEVLEAPAVIAAQGRRRVVVVFDEIQRVLEYESDLTERKLRSVTQHQPDVCYLFLGSRKHLIQKMFLDKSRPLYRSAGHYPLGPIAEQHWAGFITKRFEAGGKSVAAEAIHQVYRLTEGHPFYTQLLCHVLWELTEPGAEARADRIETALRIVLDRESHAYTMLWESLTGNQRRFLRGLASEPRGVKPFSSEFTRRYGLRSASNAQRASENLVERDLVDPENGSFVIVDRFFRLWILEQHRG